MSEALPYDPAAVMALCAPEQCAGCVRLEDPEAKTVVLLAGQTVCDYCPAWLEECRHRGAEAIAVLNLPDRVTRLEHLDKREREHGAEYRRRLAAAVLDAWESRRHREACPGSERHALPPDGEAYRCRACGSYHEGAAP